MIRPLGVFACALVLTGAFAARADVVGGRILTTADRPVEHARLDSEGGTAVTFSDRQGFFELELELPASLVVSHPRFETRVVEIERSSPALELRLVPKQEVYETIAVSANRGEKNFAPVSIATSVVTPAEAAAPASSITELVAETAAVAENGQGGIFQTYSVRGVSRQRVLTLVDGMRIVGERRAGVSASFLDPMLVGSVEVVRGPSSTYYGSGALGGVVQLFPRRFDGVSIAAGIESQGGEKHLLVASGGVASWGLALRDAREAESADGKKLNSGFKQLSGSFRRGWVFDGLSVDLTLLGSAGKEIGKANTDWPERVTTYPRERHLIARLGVERPAVWELEAALHPNRLETEVFETGVERSDLENEAFDFGLSWQRRLQRPRLGSLRLGVDYFGRRGVEARESIYDIAGTVPLHRLTQTTLEDGEEDEVGLFGAWEWNRGRSVVVTGGRLAWQRQKNVASVSNDDSAVTAFTGIVVPVGAGFEVVANAGTGLRFPSLSERFFAGTTPRGAVVGNSNLEPESSFNLDAGFHFYGERLFMSGYLFSNSINDYIERMEIEPDLLTFLNLASGRIEGVELDGFVQVGSGWSLTFGGHSFEGRDDDGLPLADIPASRLFLGTRVERGRWRGRLRWEKRAEKDDPGSGEKRIPAASLLSAVLDYELRDGLTLGFGVRNALDEGYFNSADRKVPLAPGRSLSAAMRWSPPSD